MKLVLIFLMVPALVVACPPPFNNVDFIHADNMAVAVQKYLLEKSRITNSRRWAHAVAPGNPSIVWPRPKKDPGRGTTIPYCFYSSQDKADFKDLIEAAWELWSGVLGPAGPDSGHSLKFLDTEKTCWSATSDTDGTLIWNPDGLPKGVLVIRSHNDNNYAAFATLGFIWYRPAFGSVEKPDRHEVAIRKDLAGRAGDRRVVWSVAHELGHVFGLEHEHQRPDRDHWVRFQCDKLRGYEEAKAKVLAANKHTADQLCQDLEVGYMYDFISPDYVLIPRKDSQGVTYEITHGDSYDFMSIMQYSSLQGANYQLDWTRLVNLPLVRWAKGSPTFEPPPDSQPLLPVEDLLFIGNMDLVPSAGDKEAILKLYPWDPSSSA